VAAPGILVNDSGTAPLSAIITSPITSGDLVLNTADGSFTYTPPPNFFGGASFSYVANDGTSDSNVATVTIDVTPVNDAPVAGNDSYSANQDTTLNVAAPGVLANDSDVDGDTLQALLQTAPTNGSLTLNADGSFDYVPNAGFNGADSFSYQASDGIVGTVATVDITVSLAANVAPVANDDYAETVRMNPVIIDVVANDTDVDGSIDPATVVVVTSALNGTVVNNGDGTLTYTANTRRPGSDAFSYQVMDNDGALSNVATVRVSVLKR